MLAVSRSAFFIHSVTLPGLMIVQSRVLQAGVELVAEMAIECWRLPSTAKLASDQTGIAC